MSGAFDQHHYGDDSISDKGAAELAQRIRRFWHERGFNVEVRLVRAPFEPRARQAPLTIRSDMINGLPRELVRAKQLEGQAA